MAESKPTKKIALVTGASSGLGAEFALQIEKKFFLDEIWLVARRPEPMKELAERFLKSRGVVFALDLTRRSDLAVLERRLAEEQPEVVFVVNNAGYGKVGPFAELGLDEQLQMIDLNVGSLTFLSRAAIPYMPAGSHLVQVASSIAFTPAPYFAVYAASKAFVLSLSDALGFELRERGIHVMAVCPGPVRTEFYTVAQKNEYMKNKVGRAEPFNNFLLAHPEDVVAKALRDLEHGRRRSIYGFLVRLFVLLSLFMPHVVIFRALAKRK